LSFIKIYTYKCYYAKSQQMQNHGSYMGSILPPWIIESDEYLLFSNFLCQLIWSNFIYSRWWHTILVATPLWGKCEVATHTPENGSWSPLGLPKTQKTIVGVKTLCIEVFFIPLKRSWSVDVQNGLAWAIWTFEAQVMGKRRAGSQTGSLTPDH
jgi:hypothetical protein